MTRVTANSVDRDARPWSAGWFAVTFGSSLVAGDPSSSRFAIDGPAGTGKTTMLLKAAQMAANEAGWSEVGFVSFTRNAVASARQRLSLSRLDARSVRTLHSWCASRLRLGLQGDVQGPTGLWGPYVDLDIPAHRRVFEAEVLEPLWGSCARRGRIRKTYLQLDSYARATRVPIERAAALSTDHVLREHPRRAESFRRLYAEFRERNGLLDHTDLLERVLHDGVIMSRTFVFLDEAQDFSPLEWAVVKSMTRCARCVIAAGDAAQCIYFFKGARVGQFLEFGDARLQLTVGHRLPSRLMAMAEAIAARDESLVDRKRVRARTDGGELLLLRDLADLRFTGGRYFVLARNRRALIPLEKRLQELVVPFHGTCGRGIPRDEHTMQALGVIRRLRSGGTLSRSSAFTLLDGTRPDLWSPGVRRRLSRGRSASRPSVTDLARSEADAARVMGGSVFDLLRLPADQREYLRALTQRYGESVLEPNYEPLVRTETIHGAKGLECEFVILAPDWSRLSYDELMSSPAGEHRIAHVGLTRASKAVLLLQASSKRSYPMPTPKRWFVPGALDSLLDDEIRAGLRC